MMFCPHCGKEMTTTAGCTCGMGSAAVDPLTPPVVPPQVTGIVDPKEPGNVKFVAFIETPERKTVCVWDQLHGPKVQLTFGRAAAVMMAKTILKKLKPDELKEGGG